MILAVMQPYFFPYIGYFQLMSAVDAFVFYDDAQYMKGGWINRNLIRLGDTRHWLTLPVGRMRLSARIDEHDYRLGDSVTRAENQLHASYSRAPHYRDARERISGLMEFGDSNVASYNANLLQSLAKDLAIRCGFISSSSIPETSGLKAQDKVIALCRHLGATHYVNPIGGTALYDAAAFSEAGIRLSFLRTRSAPAVLASGPQHLSIIDSLMMQGLEAVSASLREYELLEPAEDGA